MRIALTTPTGHIGSRVLSQLIKRPSADTQITVLARDPNKLPADVRAKVQVVTGSLEDVNALTKLVDHVDVLFYLIPPNFTTTDWRAWQRTIGTAAAAAVKKAKLQRVVLLSSVGAQRDDLGPISGLGEVERLFDQVAPNVLHLRAGYFMENVLMTIPTIASQAVIYQALPEDLKMPMVATADIGDAVAKYLTDNSWSGHRTVGVHGAANVSYGDIAHTLSTIFNKPIKYVRVSLDQFASSLRGAGFPPTVVDGYCEMVAGLSDGKAQAEPRTKESTTPTTFAEFAEKAIKPAVMAAEKTRTAR